MNRVVLSILLIISVAASVVNGFSTGSMNGGSSFLVSQNIQQQSSQRIAPVSIARRGDMSMMGGKMSKFGIFSPAVYGAKIVLGQEKLNKLRGKGISLHSQAIGEFCQWVGAYHLRTKLIKLAKTNGDTLGFLV
mmetsp:Transcript_13800/g.19751  ORF Transcript_13800/g.19751 Transcript_13800/m.19751 type:complete len:134 (-) Transcript_13800:285-686(-)|eukprot:CAMPEP_0184864412 /NCGR_PEP_ID=MMETSP0580-20130426/14838_1 /TAXON_ID=1118495 /ORGANISM="Dactyliosolen fragilissimus" /LENGTH=133 /DNA_ID=CAMNT_0027363181 /DNA_START=98 /DNA_END=499 /DNA_ORIENTATION=+